MGEMEISKNIRTLLENVYNHRDNKISMHRDECYYKAFSDNRSRSRAIQFSCGFKSFLKNKIIKIEDYDILAGNSQHYMFQSTTPLIFRTEEPYVVWDIGKEAETYKTIGKDDISQSISGKLTGVAQGMYCGYFARWGGSHVIAGYEKIIKEGYGSIQKDIETHLKEAAGDKKDYLQAMLITVTAAQNYIDRYAKIAAKKAKSMKRGSPKKRMERIADACEKIRSKPADSFFEAVQALWIFHELLTIENLSGSISIGRIDQLLYPFYLKDLRDGNLTFEEASEIIEALWLKFAALTMGFQNVTICGCDRNGNFAGNDISLMCIRATRKLRLDQPQLSLRYTNDLPEEYWEEAEKSICEGTAMPAIHNDRVIINAKKKAGIGKEDAWNYGIIGCVEPAIGGKELPVCGAMIINWAKVLELMLNNGKCMLTGTGFSHIERKKLDKIKSFDEFYKWFKKELLSSLKIGIEVATELDLKFSKVYPSPFLSISMENCIDSGVDIHAKDGTKYNISSINATGMASTVDSLIAIKELVYDTKKIKLPEFAEILKRNYEGNEFIHKYVVNKCEKYGNDRHQPDTLMRELVDLFCDEVNSTENGRGGLFQTGMYSYITHGLMGYLTAALPDGKKAREALSNSLCPVQGADKEGPTAAVNSVTKLDLTKLGNNMTMDLKFNPGLFKRLISQGNFRPLVDTYFDRGGEEIQFNVIGKDTLIAAQKDPVKYSGLLVRVSGFSAYFTLLDKVLQDEIIKRTEIRTL